MMVVCHKSSTLSVVGLSNCWVRECLKITGMHQCYQSQPLCTMGSSLCLSGLQSKALPERIFSHNLWHISLTHVTSLSWKLCNQGVTGTLSRSSRPHQDLIFCLLNHELCKKESQVHWSVGWWHCWEFEIESVRWWKGWKTISAACSFSSKFCLSRWSCWYADSLSSLRDNNTSTCCSSFCTNENPLIMLSQYN